MRIVEGGEYKIYAVTPSATVAMPRNWPRLWHEGNFAGALGTVPNIVTAIAALRATREAFARDGRIRLPEHIVDGDIGDFPRALKALYLGENKGKMVLRLPS